MNKWKEIMKKNNLDEMQEQKVLKIAGLFIGKIVCIHLVQEQRKILIL